MPIADNTQKISLLLEAINALPEQGSGSADPVLQALTVTPSETEQNFSPSGFDGYSSVKVHAINSAYVGSGVARQAAQTITPGESDQTIPSELYLTGAQTIKGDANLIASNIKEGVTIFDVLGTFAGSGGGGLPNGVSKLASGTITPTDDATYLDIRNHNLGVAPNFLVWFVEANVEATPVASIATDGALTIKRVRMNTTSGTVYNVHYVAHGYNASTQFGQIAGKYSNSTDMTATVARMRTSSLYMFRAGYTYRWLCGVLDGVN